MKTTNINERVKELLAPFLITDWNILPCEDLDTEVKEMNQSESSIKITDANILLWFAKGHHGSTFFLKDYSIPRGHSITNRIHGSIDCTS